MKKLDISSDLEEKIYDFKINGIGDFPKITSYFPLTSEEKQELLRSMGKSKESKVGFESIFSDEISERDWNNSKEQIKKKFRDDLIDIG